jgi:hypothetical protein
LRRNYRIPFSNRLLSWTSIPKLPMPIIRRFRPHRDTPTLVETVMNNQSWATIPIISRISIKIMILLTAPNLESKGTSVKFWLIIPSAVLPTVSFQIRLQIQIKVPVSMVVVGITIQARNHLLMVARIATAITLKTIKPLSPNAKTIIFTQVK